MMAVSMAAIQQFFADEAARIMRRGKNMLQSGKVETVTVDKDLGHIGGSVMASMKKTKYTVSMEVTKNGKIVSGSCQCARGRGKCSHMAAVLLQAHYSLSPTDVLCRWSARKAVDDNRVHTVSSLQEKTTFCPNYGPRRLDVLEQVKTSIRALNNKQGSYVLFLLKDEAERHEKDEVTSFFKVPDVEDVIHSAITEGAEDIRSFIEERLPLSWAEIVCVAEATKGQAENTEWARVRRCRLTGSRFGAILKAMKRKGGPAPSTSFLESLVTHRNLDGVKAVVWGRTHEQTAIQTFTSSTQQAVKSTGIWLHESGVLGASPDGLIGEDGIIEVKCPYSFRKSKLAEALSVKKNSKKRPYAVYLEEGKWIFDQDHEYFHQIQAALCFTKRQHAVFYVWTPTDQMSFYVEKDDQWEENICTLQRFYYECLVPFVCSRR